MCSRSKEQSVHKGQRIEIKGQWLSGKKEKIDTLLDVLDAVGRNYFKMFKKSVEELRKKIGNWYRTNEKRQLLAKNKLYQKGNVIVVLILARQWHYLHGHNHICPDYRFNPILWYNHVRKVTVVLCYHKRKSVDNV